MSVSKLDENKDWTFGKSKMNYITESNEILQNVETRIKSFKDDWFLDTEANIDWFTILGNRKNKQTITDEVRRVTLATDGVVSVDKIEVSINEKRQATIILQYTDIYNKQFLTQIGLSEYVEI